MKNNLVKSITFKDKREFKKLFISYYPALCVFASTIVHDTILAEDLIQEVFLKLWEKSEGFLTNNTIKSYLYTSVKNRCLNHLEHEKVIGKHKEYSRRENPNDTIIDQQIIEEETHRLIYNAINTLPDQCKNILLLSINGLKNSEIAEELNISVNTVKTQKKIAYKQLKIKLQDIYSLVGFMIGNIF